MLAIYIGIKWDGHLYDRKDCVKIQETTTAIYKIDTCSGETEELERKKSDNGEPIDRGGENAFNKIN